MAGINVNQITSTLAGLPDQALQQYAQMHKNDPYIMSLAVSESNRRKQMRAGAQAPQGMQEQPKVADAALAQMAPEEQGIAALPAQNMQMMADGGIAGYEGYDEGGMAYGQEPVTMMAEGGQVERYQSGGVMGDMPGYVPGARPFMPQAGAPEEVPLLRRMFREARATGSNYQVEQAKARIAAGQGTSADEAILAAAQPEQSKAPSAQDMAMFDAASNLYMTEREAGRAGKAAQAAPPATGGKAPPGAPRGPAPARAPAPDMSAAARFAALQKSMGVGDTGKEDTERAGLEAAMRKMSADEASEFEKEVAERGKYGEAKEARLAKREAGLGKQKDDLAGLALLETGLAIMSSPGKLAEAVGKSAQTGLRTYSAGLKDLRAAQEKMDEARDQIDEFRRNEDNMTAKERRQFKSQINRTEMEIKRLGVEAAAKMTDSKKADVKSIFAAETQERLTDKEIQGRKDAARISANQTPAQMQIALALGKGNLEDGLNKMKSIEAGKFSVSNSYADYLKAFAGKDTLTPPLTFANYAAQFGATLPR